MDAYWRAANSLAVGQTYLYANPLLRQPLTLAHVKPLVVGHWGTTPGQNFIYVHPQPRHRQARSGHVLRRRVVHISTSGAADMAGAVERIVVQATSQDKKAIVAKAKKLGLPISELMRRGAFAYETGERAALGSTSAPSGVPRLVSDRTCRDR